jgi:hypothetical protein
MLEEEFKEMEGLGIDDDAADINLIKEIEAISIGDRVPTREFEQARTGNNT